MMKNLRKIWAFLGSIALLSCNDSSELNLYKSVGDSWDKNNVISFEFEPQDTIQTYDMYILLRANHTYPFSNIFLITSIEEPENHVNVDTLEYLMAAPDGRLLGDGFSDIKESRLWYKKNFHFSKIGKHTIKIEQALRKKGELEGTDNLEGILDVGLRIEKSK